MAASSNIAELKFDEKVRSDSDQDLDQQPTLAHEDDRHAHRLPFKRFLHYAAIQRSFEVNDKYDELYHTQEKQLADQHSNLSPDKLESHRKLRVVNFYMVFFLITTDILGPNNAPYAISQIGYAPGVILYVALGVFAFICGCLLQKLFCKLDSNNYPIRTYADLAARLLGRWFRYLIAALHFVQLLLNVGAICLTSGQALAQIIKASAQDPKLCFTVCILIWAIVGMVLGQIRSLRTFSVIANLAVWMNITVCIITMVGVAKYPPNYRIAKATYGINPNEPIRHSAVTPQLQSDQTILSQRLSGLNQMVFAWGGATVFCEILAEMKRPHEFWKGLLGADMLIMVVYLLFGVFVYSYQGQYTYATANMGISNYNLQTASNVLNLITGIFGGVLYGNVGLKVLYQGVLVPELRFPKLTTKFGAAAWTAMVVVYWSVAYIIGTAIPIINDLVSLIGCVCTINFSYTFPFLFYFAYLFRTDAGKHDVYDPDSGLVQRYDSWRSFSRWKRALFPSLGGFVLRLASLSLFLGSLSLSALGLYAAVKSIIQDTSTSLAKAFSCTPNTDG